MSIFRHSITSSKPLHVRHELMNNNIYVAGNILWQGDLGKMGGGEVCSVILHKITP